jgi:hypothetical protein
VLGRRRSDWIRNQDFQSSCTLENIVELAKKRIDMPRFALESWRVTRQLHLLFISSQHVSERGRDTEYFSRRPTISSALHSGVSEPDAADGPEDIFDRVNRIARSLYRCYLSCKDAFPSPDTKIEWERAAWNEACAREGVHPNQLPQDGPASHRLSSNIVHLNETFSSQIEA